MKTNKMKFMSFILTFVMLINVLGVIPITISATDSTDAALITDVAVIVDDVEYRNTVATIYSNSTVYLKVYGENLQNATGANVIHFAYAISMPMGSAYNWETDANGTFATKQVNADEFYRCIDQFNLRYTNDGQSTWINSGISIVYSPIIEEEPLTEGEKTLSITGYQNTYYEFVPELSGTYAINLSCEFTYISLRVYDANFEILYSYFEEGVVNNVLEFNANDTYYFEIRILSSTPEFTIKLEKHEHANGIETCKGYLCECGTYYGEPGDHTIMGEQTCLGYYCTTCESYMGEKKTTHNLSDEQTCIGYMCLDCEDYFGEGNGVHIDENDNKINICDVCNAYLSTDTAALGKNSILLESNSFVYISFVPAETGAYKIYSVGDFDPMIYVYDAQFGVLGADDDSGDDYNFEENVPLESGKTYYFAIYCYGSSSDLPLDFYVELSHIHDNLPHTCRGYYCSECDEYFGEMGDVHVDGNDVYMNMCDNCDAYIGNLDFKLGENEIYVSREKLVFVRFVPEKDGIYLMYSTSYSDPAVSVCDVYLNVLGDADDENYYDFVLYTELKAGEEYYLAFYDYDSPAKSTVTIEYHEHSYVYTCLGYVCECGDSYGEVNDDHRLTDEATCSGYICIDCGAAFGEPNADAHVWDYGQCLYCDEYYPDDLPCEHSWKLGYCEICDEKHECENENFGKSDRCTVCGNNAGCLVITDGVETYYRGFPAALEAAVDGSTIVFLNSRAITASYDIRKNITIDINGYILRGDGDDACVNIYGNVTLIDSYGNGSFYCTLNVYGGMWILGEITLYDVHFANDVKVSDFAPVCKIVDVYIYNSEEYTYDQIDNEDIGLYDNVAIQIAGDLHVGGEWGVIKEATCYENTVEGVCCVHCNEILQSEEIDGTAGHEWHGNHGDGTKTCDGCGKTVASKVYSGDAARAVSAAVTRAAVDTTYKMLLKAAEVVADEYLEYLAIGIDFILSMLR